MRAMRSASFSVDSFSRSISTSSGKANGVGRAQAAVDELLRAHARERRAQARELELLLEHLALGLRQQRVGRVVLAEHLVEQARGGLQLALRLAAARG